jgi:thioredoxin-like negative regulator of GroEL
LLLQVGAVNCVSDQELCAQHGIQSYPTLKLVVEGKVRNHHTIE